MRYNPALLCSLALALGCSTTDPFATGPGYAVVRGQVTQSTGAPLPGVVLQITCGHASTFTIATDTAGGYFAHLNAPAEDLTRAGTPVACRFSVSDNLALLVQVDTTLGFTRPPGLAPLQTIDLREP